MGKSSKKIKNERINLIRQQYDAFLEEDKKRKERNEYILGKLDKMRSSAALVPISTKTNYHLEANPYEFCGRPKSVSVIDNYMSHIDRPKMVSNVHRQVDESTVLKEISKNYILIPKRRTRCGDDEKRIVENDIYPTETVDDIDWKNKYNILYDLKKQEKEGRSETALQQSSEMHLSRGVIPKDSEPVTYEKQISNFNEIHTPHTSPKDLRDQGNKEDIKENITISNTPHTTHDDLTVNDLQPKRYEVQINNPLVNEVNRTQHPPKNSSQEYVSEKEKYNSDINEKNENYLTENNNKLETNEVHQKSADNHENERLLQDSIQTTEKSKYTINNNTLNGLDNSMEKPSNDISQERYMQELLNEDEVLKQNRIKEIESKEPHDFALTDQAKLYEDSDNILENQTLLNQAVGNTNLPEEIEETQRDVPVTPVAQTEVVDLYDSYKSPENNYEATQHYEATEDIPAELNVAEQSEHVNHDSEITTFENEQKDMFYSEQTAGETYDYNQGGGTNEEYNAEAYPQNDQYAYYEGVQQGQEYANITEHDESTERYDPHYNQQYEVNYENQQPVNTINYENANVYDEQQYQNGNYENQQFENTANYETQQDNANYYQPENISNESDIQGNILVPQDNQIYDQQMYSETQETQEHIEQQLVSEEGYIDNSPVNVNELQKENELNTEIVNNIPTHAEPLPDPKMS